jgi:hypothetical protein
MPVLRFRRPPKKLNKNDPFPNPYMDSILEWRKKGWTFRKISETLLLRHKESLSAQRIHQIWKAYEGEHEHEKPVAPTPESKKNDTTHGNFLKEQLNASDDTT